MSDSLPLIVEIGTEELPAQGLNDLAEAFREGVCERLDKLQLDYADSHTYATPRRLAVYIEALAVAQQDRTEQRRGPALNVAFDEAGKPTPAAAGFAKSCGVGVDELETIKTDKGEWLGIDQTISGQPTTDLLQNVIADALTALPVRKRMRWGESDIEFVRPVHWLLCVFGKNTVRLELFNQQSSNITYGHRFLGANRIAIASATEYSSRLETDGHVIADFCQRKDRINEQMNSLAESLNGRVLINANLLDEVTALVEWPVAISGKFDPDFLSLPREVLIATMEKHQKSFALENDSGELLPAFIAIANLHSREPQAVIKGNEKVLQPRLSDAAFFWQRDRATSLKQRLPQLESVMYEKTLGSLAEKSARISKLATHLADQYGFDAAAAKHAGELCKCDLVTDMVGEFPELQGTIGRYYALNDGLDPEVADAIESHYLPRFAGDRLPQSATGIVLALADKLETLTGIFSTGQKPTGDKDPFALRRAALGVLRILIENKLDLDLKTTLTDTAQLFTHSFEIGTTVDDCFEFIMERLRRYYLDQSFSPQLFDAVYERCPNSPYDFDLRLRAVDKFSQLPEAENLSAANKRIQNILKKNDGAADTGIDVTLFTENAEKNLHANLSSLQSQAEKFVQSREYTQALKTLSGLQVPVDDFFDQVMVMDENKQLRNNRVALLSQMHETFMNIADVSKLSAIT